MGEIQIFQCINQWGWIAIIKMNEKFIHSLILVIITLSLEKIFLTIPASDPPPPLVHPCHQTTEAESVLWLDDLILYQVPRQVVTGHRPLLQ